MGAAKRSGIPHLTPALSAPRGGEGGHPQLNRSGRQAHKDLDRPLPGFLPIAAAGFRSRRVDCPQKAFDHLGNCDALPGGDGAAPDRAGDHLYRAQDIGCAADRRQSELDRSRRGATVRSRQSRNAAGSPARASSTALLVNAAALPSSNNSAARVARLVEPRGRPPGLPDCPLANGRPRALPAVFAVFCSEISVIAPPRSVADAGLGVSWSAMKREHYGNFSVANRTTGRREFIRTHSGGGPHEPVVC